MALAMMSLYLSLKKANDKYKNLKHFMEKIRSSTVMSYCYSVHLYGVSV